MGWVVGSGVGVGVGVRVCVWVWVGRVCGMCWVCCGVFSPACMTILASWLHFDEQGGARRRSLSKGAQDAGWETSVVYDCRVKRQPSKAKINQLGVLMYSAGHCAGMKHAADGSSAACSSFWATKWRYPEDDSDPEAEACSQACSLTGGKAMGEPGARRG